MNWFVGEPVKRVLVQWVAVWTPWRCWPAPAAAQEPSLATVLARAGRLRRRVPSPALGIVAEEQYVQDWSQPVAERHAARQRGPAHRELKSDLLLVKPAGADAWMAFRDVFEVDGDAGPRPQERLAQLFLERTPSSRRADSTHPRRERALQHRRHPAQRQHAGLPLLFLEPANQFRFKFKRTTDRRPRTEPANRGASRRLPRLDRGLGDRLRGEASRDADQDRRPQGSAGAGQLLDRAGDRPRPDERALATNRKLRATIDVSYQSEPLLGLLVPIEMREWYDNLRNGSRIEAVATYGKFRQFQVNTNETFLIKK